MANEISETRARTGATMSDNGWNQMQELVRMLQLVAVQAQSSLRDGNQSVDSLSRSFTAIVAHLNDMDAVVQDMASQGSDPGEAKRDLVRQHFSRVSDQVNQAIVAFQFYDKLVQRIEHVVANLDQLATMTADDARFYSPVEWHALQKAMREGYTMAEERVVFDAWMQGEDVQAALARVQQQASGPAASDDIELF